MNANTSTLLQQERDFQIGERVYNVTLGPGVVKATTPVGINVQFDLPNSEGETEDTLSSADLMNQSEYSAWSASHDEAVIAQIKMLFEPGDLVCLTGIHSTKKTDTGSAEAVNIVRKLEDITPVAVAWMRSQNSEGSNRYVAMGPLLPGKDRRTKENFAAARSVFMECDFDGEKVLAQVHEAAAAGKIPLPTIVLRSSPGKYQFAWRVNADDFDASKVEAVNGALVNAFSGDPACTDRLRVFRLTSFANLKYPERPACAIVETNAIGRRYNFADFQIPMAEAKATVVKPAASESEVAAAINYFDQAAEETKLHIKSFKKWGSQGFIYEITCPFVDSHTGRKDSGTVVMVHSSAAISFKCQHGHCAERTWQKDVRPEMERIVGHSLRFGDPVGNVIVGQKQSTGLMTVNSPVWGDPQAFDNSLLPVQPFKLDFLPSSLQPWAKDVSERMGVPLDFPGISMLCALSGCINRRAFVYPKALDKEWREAIAISGAVVALSGKLKTPTWKTSVNPMMEIDIDWQNEYKARLATYKNECKVYEDEQKLVKKEASKARKKDQSDAGPLYKPTAAPMPKVVAPPADIDACRRLVLNDATPESFHDIMSDNPEGLFVYRDEMTGWVAELDQKGRESERSLFLKAMNGDDPYTLDRIGRGTVSARVSASLFGGFQPEPLVKFLCDSRNTTDGMLARFWLLVWPDDTFSSPPVDRIANSSAKDMFRTVIRRLANLRAESVFLHFSPDAQAKFNDWLISHVLKTDKETNAAKQSHLSKYRGLLPKLAGLFQLVDMASSMPEFGRDHLIDLDHLNRAIALLAYLESHMNRIYACVKSLEQKAVEALAQHVKAGDLRDGFSARDIQRKGWESLSKNYVEDAILTLEDLGWLRLVSSEENSGRGRPTLRWEINPNLKSKVEGSNHAEP